MFRLIALLLGGSLAASMAMAQFGGRPGDVVIYAVTSKGSPEFHAVPANTVNTQAGFQIVDTLSQPPAPFGDAFPGESYITLHSEDNDSFRYIIQKENIQTQHNTFAAAAKLLIAEGIDRLLIPNKTPVDLTAGLYAPFPANVDFGPELPEMEAHSFMWTASPTFPLLVPADPSYRSPLDPPGQTGSEYVLSLGSFDALVPWIGLNTTYPGQGWKQGIDVRTMETDAAAGVTVRMIRLRPGRATPPFVIDGNTHLAVLQGSVNLTPTSGGQAVTLTRFQYAFIPNGFAIVLSNPAAYSGPTADFNPFAPYPNPFNPVQP
ncbi:MAG TPA: hypothetical protein VHC72_00360 [Bryobacteraceae bacterium]|nr:hypothetical protein [Bryobacteraceae bacterium]